MRYLWYRTHLKVLWKCWQTQALFEHSELYLKQKKLNSMVICIAFISKTYSITAIFKCDGRTGPSWKRTQRRGLRGVLFDGEGAASGGAKGCNFHLTIDD